MEHHAQSLVAIAREQGGEYHYTHVTKGDGSCFFHAIADQIQNRPEVRNNMEQDLIQIASNAHNLRTHIVNTLKHVDSHPDENSSFHISINVRKNDFENDQKKCVNPQTWNYYLNNMYDSHTFAENTIIELTAIILKRNINLVGQQPSRILGEITNTYADSDIILGYVPGVHFQSLYPGRQPIQITTNNISQNSIHLSSHISKSHQPKAFKDLPLNDILCEHPGCSYSTHSSRNLKRHVIYMKKTKTKNNLDIPNWYLATDYRIATNFEKKNVISKQLKMIHKSPSSVH